MKANLATSLIAYARGGVRKQLLVLCLLTLCIGNMWGADFTVYVTGEIFTGTGDNAWDNQKSVIKVDVRFQGNDYDFKDGDVYWNQEMTCTNYTYNGYPIYSYTFPPTHSGGQFRFKHYKNGDWKEDYTSDWHSTTEQIYRGYHNGHQWMVYGRDVTVYTVPDYLFKDYTTKFSEETHYPSVCVQYGNSEWKTINMVKTDYTYDNYPIWKATFLLDYNIFKEFQIKYFDKANSQQVGLYQYNQGGNTEYPSSYLDDKLYHGWNGESHDFFPYTYDVKLDQQGGSSGTESIKATDGADLPVATMPGRDGYIFGGYYTGIGGAGDQYYDNNGNSSAQWNSRTITTLYAKWTARKYTVKLEDMEPTTVGQGSVSVMFDASDNMTSAVTQPTKTHYDFRGYWTDNNDSGATLGVQLIDENGNWIKDVSPYTGSDADGNPTWIYPNDISLFAKWEEHPYTISLVVSPKGAGTIDKGTTIEAYYVTASDDITATASTGYSFREWDFSITDGANDVYSADGYTSTSNPIRIKAQHDGTLTATFTANNYIVNLENLGADEGYKGTENVSVTYNSSVNLTENITIPQKAHYDFGGYYTGYDELNKDVTGVQVINADGEWIASVERYTDGDKNWLYADNLTLYAKWTEHPYTINLVVSPEGAGTIDKETTIAAYYTTASDEITATASTGYSFSQWGFSKQGESDWDVWCADDYTFTNATIRILARHDGTLTANFTANGYTVTLEDLDADEGHKGTSSVSVTYDATTNLTSSITSPQKAHYDFGGYWTSTDEGAHLTTQLIDDKGAWIADVSGYTSASKQWIYAGDITLYAKWTETAYTITPSVSPAGAGSVNTVTDAHLITPSSTITATPANAAWTFDYWEYGEHVGYASGSGNAITVTASQNSTITAHFKPRFSLVGSLYEGDEGGMPGWEDYTKTFAVNSTSPMDLSRTCTLQANSTYKVQVHDNATGTNLGRSGCDPVCVLEENASLVMENSNNDVFLYTSGAGEYIFKITAVDGSGHPTLTVLRPYPVNFGQKYQDIDGTLHTGTTGGTAAATAGSALSSGDYVTYNTSVTHTATPAGGYTFAGWWSSDAFEGDRFSNTNPMTYAVTSGDNAYAKFVETSTSVTLANDGNGKVQIGGVDKTSTTCGVTTTRELTAVPNEGYKFLSWTLPENADFEMIEGNVDNPTITLRGKGAGTEGEIRANFTECWVLSAQSEGWGSTEFTIANIEVKDGKAIGYADIALPANTNLQFKVVDKSTSSEYKNGVDKVYYMTYDNSQDWSFGTDKTYNCGITTAGRGSYRFNWNFTDTTMTVVYPVSYQVNYGAAVGGSVTSVLDDDGNVVPNGGYVREGGSVTYEATANNGYTFTGWCPDDSYGDTFTDYNPWENSNITATSNAYAKFHSTNFVIYRTGDKSSDPRAVWDDVESYKGETISETIEFRMRVNRLDYWYTLCLPFTVSAVKVWDEEDGQYYDLLPYYRTVDKYYTGHYIIRTPDSTTNFAIENFDSRDRWVDPSSADGYLPSNNTPYIIQWHDEYFQDKYISFLGAAGQEIPTAMDQGANTSDDETVNIYGNNSMTSGTVRDAYMLDSDYGSGGAWLRAEVGTDRTVLPFECFIRANTTTTAKYRVLRRDMADDTPTGLDTLSMTEDSVSKVMINNRIYIIRGGKIYTIQGTFVKEVE